MRSMKKLNVPSKIDFNSQNKAPHELSLEELQVVAGGDDSSGSDDSGSSDDNVQKKHVSNIKWTPGKA
jgi:hypothetical protein